MGIPKLVWIVVLLAMLTRTLNLSKLRPHLRAL